MRIIAIVDVFSCRPSTTWNIVIKSRSLPAEQSQTTVLIFVAILEFKLNNGASERVVSEPTNEREAMSTENIKKKVHV